MLSGIFRRCFPEQSTMVPSQTHGSGQSCMAAHSPAPLVRYASEPVRKKNKMLSY